MGRASRVGRAAAAQTAVGRAVNAARAIAGEAEDARRGCRAWSGIRRREGRATGSRRSTAGSEQRLARGTEPIDARIDLHGRTQGEAHARLLRFLRGAQATARGSCW